MIEEKEDIALQKWKQLKNKDEVVHISEATENNGNLADPFPLGFSIFDDEMIGGVRGGDFVVITGLSGQGKSSLMLCIASNFSKAGFSSLIFSYEVIIDNLFAKFKAMDADTEKLKVYTPKKLKSGNVGWIYQKIIEGVEKFGTKFIFIDHLDFLTPQRQTDEQRRIVISDICIELKNLAKELGVVVFLLAHVRKVQFSRAVELQDLSESGATYKLADFVFTIEREASIENISGKKAEVYRTNNGTVRMLKNRLTGVQPIMNFQMCSDIIVPIEYADEKKESGELNIEVVDEEDKKISLFGGTND